MMERRKDTSENQKYELPAGSRSKRRADTKITKNLFRQAGEALVSHASILIRGIQPFGLISFPLRFSRHRWEYGVPYY